MEDRGVDLVNVVVSRVLLVHEAQVDPGPFLDLGRLAPQSGDVRRADGPDDRERSGRGRRVGVVAGVPEATRLQFCTRQRGARPGPIRDAGHQKRQTNSTLPVQPGVRVNFGDSGRSARFLCCWARHSPAQPRAWQTFARWFGAVCSVRRGNVGLRDATTGQMRYRSSIGCHHFFPWAPAMVVFAASWTSDHWLLAGLGVCVAGAFCRLLLASRYVVEAGVLDARMGVRRRRIRLCDVTAVHRWQLDGPVLGVGPYFIGIEYGNDRTINVSPKDVDGFMAAVRAGMKRADGRRLGPTAPALPGGVGT